MLYVVLFLVYQLFKAMKLQLYTYKQSRKHCSNFIETAVVHHWKADQDAILERLSQEGNVILGGDMRADSPGNWQISLSIL